MLHEDFLSLGGRGKAEVWHRVDVRDGDLLALLDGSNGSDHDTVVTCRAGVGHAVMVHPTHLQVLGKLPSNYVESV